MTGRLQRTVAELCPAQLDQPVLAAVFDYWNAKRGARAMPCRADINPLDLKEHLGWIFLVDVLPELNDFRFRLVGTKVARYFGADSTGQTITEAFAVFGEGPVKGIQAVFRKAARDMVPMRARGDVAWLADEFDHFDSLYLPLSEDGKSANMIFSAFVFDYAAVAAKSQSALP